jgi:hypothetical protein
MANTYTWKIVQLDCLPDANGLLHVIQDVHWRLEGTDGTYSSYVYGSVALSQPHPDDFILYDDLTEDQIINWVINSIGNNSVADYQTTIDTKIAASVDPQKVYPSLPWKNHNI